MDYQLLQQKLGITFQNENILKQAFIHSSYVNEHRLERADDNERLEFLGDAILELGVSHFLYHRIPAMSEGEMTKLRAFLVRESTLFSVAKKLEFGQFLMLGKGEESSGGRKRPSILADVFEAFLGALYVDQGFDRVYEFLEEHLYIYAGPSQFSSAMDYKTTLQEIVQRESRQQVSYAIIEERGPAHDREFVAQVTVNEWLATTGTGLSKKEAEQRAAKKAIDSLRAQQ
ncbi:MAG TPA: ribonuclease III [Bacillota bacterium]|nr:ribonuclease III [Bacillota bacterium]